MGAEKPIPSGAFPRPHSQQTAWNNSDGPKPRSRHAMVRSKSVRNEQVELFVLCWIPLISPGITLWNALRPSRTLSVLIVSSTGD